MTIGSPLELRVMSFNIRYGTAEDGENSWLQRKDAVLDFLATCQCDIIGLQEALAPQLSEIQQAIPFYHRVGVGRDDGLFAGEFTAILYDTRRIEVGASETFWFSETPMVTASTSWGNQITRICTHGTFNVDGHAFDLYNLHIDHESPISRLKSVELLVHRIRARTHRNPVIVTGDFNEGETGPAIELMRRLGFMDTYRTVFPDGLEPSTFHGWTGGVEGTKIDYIFVEQGLSVVDAGIVRETPYNRALSDHYPVVATIEL